jgi:hypothetical protein
VAVHKSQFAATSGNSDARDQIPCPSGAQTGTGWRDQQQTNKEAITNSGSTRILDHESLAVLRQFFELLDEWEQKEDQP